MMLKENTYTEIRSNQSKYSKFSIKNAGVLLYQMLTGIDLK